MNQEYTNFKKRYHILINVYPGDHIEKVGFQTLYQSIGGLILHENDFIKFSNKELIDFIQLLYVPLFIQKGNEIYLMTWKLKRSIQKDDLDGIQKNLLLLKKPFAIIKEKSFIFNNNKGFKESLPIFLHLKNLDTFSSYFETTDFLQTYSGFVLDFDDYQNDISVVDVLKKYF